MILVYFGYFWPCYGLLEFFFVFWLLKQIQGLLALRISFYLLRRGCIVCFECILCVLKGESLLPSRKVVGDTKGTVNPFGVFFSSRMNRVSI